jgi:hypothetical protein
VVPSLAGSTSAGSDGDSATACLLDLALLVFASYRSGLVRSYTWLWPCTARSTWYRENSGASADRTPPSELWPLQVENAHSW